MNLEKKIVGIIKSNPQFSYEEMKKEALGAGVSEALFDKSWLSAHKKWWDFLRRPWFWIGIIWLLLFWLSMFGVLRGVFDALGVTSAGQAKYIFFPSALLEWVSDKIFYFIRDDIGVSYPEIMRVELGITILNIVAPFALYPFFVFLFLYLTGFLFKLKFKFRLKKWIFAVLGFVLVLGLVHRVMAGPSVDMPVGDTKFTAQLEEVAGYEASHLVLTLNGGGLHEDVYSYRSFPHPTIKIYGFRHDRSTMDCMPNCGRHAVYHEIAFQPGKPEKLSIIANGKEDKYEILADEKEIHVKPQQASFTGIESEIIARNPPVIVVCPEIEKKGNSQVQMDCLRAHPDFADLLFDKPLSAEVLTLAKKLSDLRFGIGDLASIENPSEEIQIYALQQHKDAECAWYGDIKNPSLKVQLAAVTANPACIQYIPDASVEMQKAALGKDPQGWFYRIKYIKNPSEEIQMAIVNLTKTPPESNKIRSPSDPIPIVNFSTENLARQAMGDLQVMSEAAQLVAIGISIDNFKYIKNPTPAMIKRVEDEQVKEVTSFKGSCAGIIGIQNPSERVQIEAMKVSPSCIDRIQNPSEAVQLAAISENPRVFEDIKNPSEKVQAAAVSADPNNLLHISNPSEEVLLAAVRNKEKTCTWLYLIKNLSEKLLIEGAKWNPKCCTQMQNPSDDVLLAALQTDPTVFMYMHMKMGERIQIAAVTADPKNLQYIKNPSEAVLSAARNASGNN